MVSLLWYLKTKPLNKNPEEFNELPMEIVELVASKMMEAKGGAKPVLGFRDVGFRGLGV